MAHLSKTPTIRKTNELVRDGGKLRMLIVTVYPSGMLGLRLERTRREETLPLSHCWSLAVKMRVEQERQAKKRAKREKQ